MSCQTQTRGLTGMFVDHQTPKAEQLARQCQEGSREAFEQLVHQYADRIYRFLRQMVGNHADAEDLAQETFVKAYLGIGSYNPAFAFSPWLFAIARHTAASHYRRRRSFEPLSDECPAESPNPAGELESRESHHRLWDLARRLKPKQYEALWLRYGEGFTVAEVAQIMQTNGIHVKVLLHRARHHLARHLGQPQSLS